ncbi:MAG TPA: DUF2716 domain-containing protein [Lentzea sp.]
MIRAYDERRLGRTPLGAVVERDGVLVRFHHGTHVTIEHAAEVTGDLAALVERQKNVAAERHEPVEWRIHRHHAAPGLAEELARAGFTEDLPGHVMVAPASRGTTGLPSGVRIAQDKAESDEARQATRATRRVWADNHPMPTWYVLRRKEELDGVLWLLDDQSTFLELGMTDAHPEFGPALHGVVPSWPFYQRYLLVEGDSAVRDLVEQYEFRELTTIRTFRWAPAGTPATTRPIRPIGDREYEDLLGRFTRRFSLKPSTHRFPAIAEPADSVTWAGHLDVAAEITAVVRRGLEEVTEPGELIFWADPYHYGSAADLRRVDGPAQPRWHEPVAGDGDYAINTTFDLRAGTFAHPWEDSLCVWGAELLKETEEALDALMPRLRTGGRVNRTN